MLEIIRIYLLFSYKFEPYLIKSGVKLKYFPEPAKHIGPFSCG